MKKLVFLFTILFSTAIFSCNTKPATEEIVVENEDSVTVVDTICIDTVN